jgi:hypothetical protein
MFVRCYPLSLVRSTHHFALQAISLRLGVPRHQLWRVLTAPKPAASCLRQRVEEAHGVVVGGGGHHQPIGPHHHVLQRRPVAAQRADALRGASVPHTQLAVQARPAPHPTNRHVSPMVTALPLEVTDARHRALDAAEHSMVHIQFSASFPL